MWRSACLVILVLLGAACPAVLARDMASGTLTEATPDARARVQATLDRIARNERDPHANDGSVYRNLNRALPQRPRGYYREYVYRGPRQYRSVGPERVIVGQGNEIYYTPDHYRTFQQVTPQGAAP